MQSRRRAVVLCVWTLVVLAAACAADDPDEVSTDTNVSRPAGPTEMGTWAPNLVVGGTGPGSGLYFLGGHRLASDGRSYEVHARAFHTNVRGEMTQVADPPIMNAIGIGSGVAFANGLFVMLQDCSPSGDASGAGYGCAQSGIQLRFLHYDLGADEWTELELPSEVSELDPFTPPTLVPGQFEPGGPLYFSISSPSTVGLATAIIAFDTTGGYWSVLATDDGGLPIACSDGSSVYFFDSQTLLDEFGRIGSQPPGDGTSRLTATLRVLSVRKEESLESVVVDYPEEAGLEPADVLEILPWCMADGTVLVTIGLATPGLAEHWPLRSGAGDWSSVRRPETLVRPFLWEVVAFPDSIAFLASEGERPGNPLPGISFDRVSRSWSSLPDRPSGKGPVPIVPAGSGQVGTYRTQAQESASAVQIWEAEAHG